MFPLEQFQLEHGQTMFSEQIAPLSTPPKRSLNDVKPRTCSNWAGLSTQTAISMESARYDLIHCAVYTQ